MHFKVILFISLFCLLTPELNAWKFFHKGRSVGGNLGSPVVDENAKLRDITDEWFTQNLDHFDPVDNRTWQQRYQVNDEFYDAEKGGPVFLMIGGEGEASPKWMTAGAWIDDAKKFGALCFQLEHRFYGKSHPTEDMSTKNLVYLSSQQALADLANFIVSMNKKYDLPEDQKWIAFGGSYPGSLAAWLRFKYPHLVHGAMLASGPLLAEIDFEDYFKVVVEALRTHSDECVDAIKNGTKELEQTLQENDFTIVDEYFMLCDSFEGSLNNSNDISNFYETIADNFAGIVQYNEDNRIGDNPMKNITIDVVCDIMTTEAIGTPMFRMAAVNALLLMVNNEKCLDYKYQNMIDSLRNISWESSASEGGRQWTYQTCTEFGFYQTSNYEPQIFGKSFPIEFFIQQCEDIFGPRYNETLLQRGVDRTNMMYGALNIEVSNVVFVHGTIDPWHALGITKTVDQNAPAILIEGTAHCANMYPASENDLPQLKAARQQVTELIDTWIRL